MVGSLEVYERCKFVNLMTASDIPAPWLEVEDGRLRPMADWATISALATAGGTLVLAAATFASVRSANRSARLAQRSLELGLRPLLMPSRLEDAAQKIQWGDAHWAHVEGGRASVEVADSNIYLAMSVRNPGTGVAVLQAWQAEPLDVATAGGPRPDLDRFRSHVRDLYIPAGDIGFWQAAIRDPNDAAYPGVLQAIERRQPLMVDVLYGDHESGRRIITRFTVSPAKESEWLCAVVRHWNLDQRDG